MSLLKKRSNFDKFEKETYLLLHTLERIHMDIQTRNSSLISLNLRVLGFLCRAFGNYRTLL